MLVVTAGTSEYRGIIDAQGRICDTLRYKRIVFDLGGLGIGEKYEVPSDDLRGVIGDSMPPTTFKPRLLSEQFRPHATMCWLDGDCLPLREFYPEGNWDVAVTLRPKDEIGQSGIMNTDFLNAGVVWVRSIDFVNSWIAKAAEIGNDQGALNQLIAPDWNADEWRRAHNTFRWTPYGMRALILDAMEWNCWHLPPKQDTRILHFKRGIRAAAKGYCN